ncbi:MAG TPA: ABC transporter substrate-binding protein [Candidatus Baltobacteraceae bacterium]|nr:ABC transporter substrate-binding protein [Candidatus Baltobacteraceae bacterium]
MRAFSRAAAALLAALFSVCLAAGAATLKVGSDVSYAPLEFYGPGHRMQGFDIDLAQALGKRLGEPVAITNHTFDDLLRSVQDGRFDVGISAISDTRARERQVDFVDYLLAGSGMLVRAGNPLHIFDLGGLCGLRVDVQRGTSQETELLEQSKRCREVHLAPIKLITFATDDQAFQAFAAGKSDVHVTDFPVVAYLAESNDHLYTIAGRQFDLVPYGIAVPKNNPALRARVIAALHGVIADGTYDALLKKWGLEQGALRSAPTDAGTLFSK